MICVLHFGLVWFDRCILDLVRVMEVLLVVLLEGRHALPKSSSSCAEPCALRRLDNSNRHLIEIIRNRDFDGLVDVVENGSVDVNLVDDVGQTLLNWYVDAISFHEKKLYSLALL